MTPRVRTQATRKQATVVSVALVLAACGSTAQMRGTAAVGGADVGTTHGGSTLTTSPPDGGRGASTSGGSTSAAGLVTTGGAMGTGSSGGTSSGTGTSGMAAEAKGPSGSSSDIPATGPGWDAHTVYIGITTQQDVQKTAQAAGINSADSGDQKADVEAVLKHVNAQGGLFGRKVQGLYFDIQSAGDANTQSQAACTYFTQDHHVVAVYAAALVADNDTFRACLVNKHIPILAGGDQTFDDKVFNDLHGYYNLMPFPSYTRFATALVRRLQSQSYFSSWDATLGQPGTAPAKTGVICSDTVVGRRIGALITAAPAKAGHTPAVSVYYTSDGDVQGYVLRMKAAGVTHVLMCDIGLFVFAIEAESQHFRPRYGISTFNTPVLFLQGVVPSAQLAGSMGVGYDPTLDVDAAHDPTVGQMPAIARCLKIGEEAGVLYPDSKRFAHAVLYDTCDIVNLIVAAAERVHALDGPSLKAGIGLVGPSYESAVTLRGGLSPTVHGNPAGTRDLVYVTRCQCYEYRGNTLPID